MEKRLYRSTRNHVFGGVCGGMGEYFDIDPVLLRLVWVVFALMLGSGLLVYIVACLIIPKNPGDYNSRPGSSAYYSNPFASGTDPENTNGTADGSSTEGPMHYEDPYASGISTDSSKNGMLLIGLCFLVAGILGITRIVAPWIPGGLLLAGALVALGLYFVFSSIGREK